MPAPRPYDVVIVGAGSAGCALAHGLSAESACRVLLLEAGGSDRHLRVRIPAAFSKLYRSPLDWAFETDPEPHLGGRRLYVPRGRVVGGSSSLNAMIYMRGNPLDYDGWRDAGCPGWGWADVLPCFRRVEDQQRGASPLHGTGGPLHVQDLRQPHPLSEAFVEAAVAAGLERNPDFNGERQDGAGLYQVTQRNGRRWSAADAFLRPALRRPNLELWMRTRVLRLLLDGRRIRGLAVLRGGRPATVSAGAVVLAAGAIQSPQLLLLSGIGPGQDLRRLGLGVVHDLPGVGRGLQDHPVAVVSRFARRGLPTLDGAGTLSNLLRWAATRGGPLASCVAEAGAFARSRGDLPAPDLQLLFAPAFFENHTFDNPRRRGMSVGVTLIAPLSRGRVTLRSADPLQPPRIAGGYLAHDEEWRALLAGLRLARRILAQAPFAAARGEELSPGEGVEDDEALRDYVRRRAEVLYHPVGTCPMGSGVGAVVDPALRVHGIEGLLVADASVMPAIVRGNTNAPAMLIGDRAADLLRGSGAAGRAPAAG